MMEQSTQVHGNTKKAADISLAKKEISPASHKAVHEGRISLDEARELGREGSPYGPAPKSTMSKDDTTQECWCGCQQITGKNRRWRQGHDQVAKGIILRAVRAGNTSDLSDRLREYGEERGLI